MSTGGSLRGDDRAFVGGLDERKQLDWREAFTARFPCCREEGALAPVDHAWAGKRSSWYWSTVRVYHLVLHMWTCKQRYQDGRTLCRHPRCRIIEGTKT